MRFIRNVAYAILLAAALVTIGVRVTVASGSGPTGDVCSQCDCVFVWPDYILVQCANHYECTESYPDFCGDLWDACGRHCPGGIWFYNC
jgi:hypothetical protein